MNILLIYGGVSCERTGSLASADNMKAALNDLNVNVYALDYQDDLQTLYRFIQNHKVDLIVNTMHGNRGEDGIIQGFFETCKIPYAGTAVLGSALSMNKYMTKLVLKGAGYKVAQGICLKRNDRNKAHSFLKEKGIQYPLIVKSNNQGSKLGINLVINEPDLLESIDNAFQYDHEIVIEQFISGKEIAVCMFYQDCRKVFLPIVEVGHDTYDKTFMLNEKSPHIIPAGIDKRSNQKAIQIAGEVFDLFSVNDYGRLDMIIDGDDYYILEVSTIPGFAEYSIFPKAISHIGLSKAQVMKGIISSAQERVDSDGKR